MTVRTKSLDFSSKTPVTLFLFYCLKLEEIYITTRIQKGLRRGVKFITYCRVSIPKRFVYESFKESRGFKVLGTTYFILLEFFENGLCLVSHSQYCLFVFGSKIRYYVKFVSQKYLLDWGGRDLQRTRQENGSQPFFRRLKEGEHPNNNNNKDSNLWSTIEGRQNQGYKGNSQEIFTEPLRFVGGPINI